MKRIDLIDPSTKNWLHDKYMTDYMLDTSAVGEIDDGKVDTRSLYNSGDHFYITHIQKDELSEAGPYSRFLLSVLEVVDADNVPTDGSYLGLGKLGGATLGVGEDVETIRNELEDDGGNETRDALIAGTAVANGFILVTHDCELRHIVNSNTSGDAISISKFNFMI